MKIDSNSFPGLKHYTFSAEQTQDNFGILHNENGTFAAPTVDSLAFFNEADFFSESLLLKKCEEIKQKLYNHMKAYEQFVRQKGRRPNHDIYACFQPFNEAFKAFFPFIKILRKHLQKGDIILNLWDRTTWSSAFLAGLFPDQRVINLWEGNKDILGYRGFNFWLNDTLIDEKQIQIAFCDLDQGLPFDDASIGLAFGLDTFHNFNQSNLLKELYRIVKPNGAILFPHVHLTNNEPEPFFERGCRQLHGLEYQAFFQQFEKTSGRKGYILPEPEMFIINELSDQESHPIKSQPESHHYNAMIAILPDHWEKTEQLQAFRFDDLENHADCRVLINPLYDIDLHTNMIILNDDKIEGRVGYLLERHPVYLRKTKKTYPINNNESKMLYWAMQLKTLSEISLLCGLNIDVVKASFKKMQQADIVQVVPVSENHLCLQNFISTQQYVLPKSKQTVSALWERVVKNHSENVFIFSELDDSELTYEEADTLIKLIRSGYSDKGLKTGDKIAIISPNHFEAILSVLAALQSGIVVVPIDYELAQPIIEHILSEIKPKLIFTGYQNTGELLNQTIPLIQFDVEEQHMTALPFSEWLPDETLTTIDEAELKDDSLACILYTSGSTGVPKGVMHTHGHLIRSGRLITETFYWKSESRFFTPGELDSMSGFRNQVIAPLEVGASIVIAQHERKTHLFSLLETIETYGVTILGTTPVLLGQLVQYEKRTTSYIHSLKTVICTGSNLSSKLKSRFYELFQLVPLNYYGLTETTGICLSEGPENYQLDQNTIGIPRGCIAQIVNEQGQPVGKGEKGILRIYGNNIMQAYFNKPTQTKAMIKDGWLYTGDIAQWQENGHMELHGRTRDIIKIASGQLVFASEIEDCLLGCKELVTAVAVGAIPFQESEKIIAFVCLVNQTMDLNEAESRLSNYVTQQIGVRKTPSKWVFLEELPVSANGKILKAELLQNLTQND